MTKIGGGRRAPTPAPSQQKTSSAQTSTGKARAKAKPQPTTPASTDKAEKAKSSRMDTLLGRSLRGKAAQGSGSAASSPGGKVNRAVVVPPAKGPDKSVKVKDAKGNDITLTFTSKPPAHKKVVGDVDKARQDLAGMVGAENKAEWAKVDKHDIYQVKHFLASQNLPPNKKAEFVQKYMTAYYNHPGKDINWGGASLQDGINAVPVDRQGRKYLDCEGFVKLGQTLLGEGKVKPYVLDANFSGSRNHQVGIYREGGKAWVINNNQITRVPNTKGKNPQQIIQQVEKNFTDVTFDTSGPMRFGTESFKVGQELKDNKDIVVKSIDNSTTLKGTRMMGGGSTYTVRVEVDPKTGKYQWKDHYETGDSFKSGNRRVNIGEALPATPEDTAAGRRRYRAEVEIPGRGKVTGVFVVQPDGNWTLN